ncbi:MAG: putative peptidyl-prolyl cis-trans isomerase [Candidatus Ordinivivax streblomastigis]|uniref:Peptidyl-prolyl cis-trans isomerase n=1 Tax=Candidatus Ordinivivax streblomastigis TaxID=2540710 RepID=A0A5M8P0R8_9BACT|nr:MAG: putative peptidyl-prolyl cis-trans isomerase [Candidatus Ordinivivax streblomastigis]
MTYSCQTNAQTYTIATSLGNIQIQLYDQTPLHKANFETLVEKQAYDSVLFHRIIEGFMIQTGDLSTKPGASRTASADGKLIPAEFVKEYIHKKGALAAARTGDQVNPEKKSSPTQFYIVQGRTFADNELQQMEEFGKKTWTPEQKEIYKTIGGTPFLDQDYTVFGEVVVGLDVVDKIAALPTGRGDYPLSDIRILSITKD